MAKPKKSVSLPRNKWQILVNLINRNLKSGLSADIKQDLRIIRASIEIQAGLLVTPDTGEQKAAAKLKAEKMIQEAELFNLADDLD